MFKINKAVFRAILNLKTINIKIALCLPTNPSVFVTSRLINPGATLAKGLNKKSSRKFPRALKLNNF